MEKYLEDLKKLASGELVAATQYQIAAQGLIGPNQSYLAGHFAEHHTEELDHYLQIVNALMERGVALEVNLHKTLDEGMPPLVELETNTTQYLRKFFADREQEAIDAYQKFHEEIKDIDADLDDIVVGIIADERDHKLDMDRLEEESELLASQVEFERFV